MRSWRRGKNLVSVVSRMCSYCGFLICLSVLCLKISEMEAFGRPVRRVELHSVMGLHELASVSRSVAV